MKNGQESKALIFQECLLKTVGGTISLLNHSIPLPIQPGNAQSWIKTNLKINQEERDKIEFYLTEAEKRGEIIISESFSPVDEIQVEDIPF